VRERMRSTGSVAERLLTVARGAHLIVSAGSPGKGKRWECRCFAPWADDHDDDSRSCLLTPSARTYGSEGWGFESLRARSPSGRSAPGETKETSPRYLHRNTPTARRFKDTMKHRNEAAVLQFVIHYVHG
jgi:hypothetical protein